MKGLECPSGIADLVTMDVSSAPEIERLRRQAFDGLAGLIERGKAVGALRADLTTEDVLILLMANAGLVERAHSAAAEASARLVHVLLDGFRVEAATVGPPPPSARRMRLAMRANSDRLHMNLPPKDG